ncbi:MAG: MltA domain-containing protein [Planctomycetes bacterium]|nr:MltA domain-containing protein [Planctomycetota bacterium]
MLASRLSLALALALLGGCVQPPPRRTAAHAPRAVEKKDYDRELPPGAHALRRITDPAQLPDFTAAFGRDRAALRRAVDRSLAYLGKPSSRRFYPVGGIEHEQVVAGLVAFRALLDSDHDAAALAAEVRRRFAVYTTVGCDDRGTVLFTGYYTPIFEASRRRGGEFRHPLHRLPPDHVKDPITGATLGRRRADGTVDRSYPDRAALLAAGALDGLELVWLRDPFEAYVAGVQGSAFLRLEDGTRLEVGYAGNNGHEYASIGAALVRDGKLRKDQLNLRSMIAHFRAHPADFERYAAENRRYVFFQESSGGPYGCLNERVEAMASIATDKAIFPRGALCLVDADLPGEGGRGTERVRAFVLDQDAGGAIRAPGRCDVYMGVGEDAGARAGRTLSEGRLYYLVLDEPGTVPASFGR